MPQRLSRAMRLAASLAGTAAMVFGLALVTGSETAGAAPGFIAGVAAPASQVTPARIYRRGRTPIYPYYYNPGRPGGYSFYFGFVPYAKGDYEHAGAAKEPLSAEYRMASRRARPAPGLGTEAFGLSREAQRRSAKNCLSRAPALVSPRPPTTSGA